MTADAGDTGLRGGRKDATRAKEQRRGRSIRETRTQNLYLSFYVHVRRRSTMSYPSCTQTHTHTRTHARKRIPHTYTDTYTHTYEPTCLMRRSKHKSMSASTRTNCIGTGVVCVWRAHTAPSDDITRLDTRLHAKTTAYRARIQLSMPHACVKTRHR